MVSTTSASRAQRRGVRPARSATSASAVPQAPPPTMPIRLMPGRFTARATAASDYLSRCPMKHGPARGARAPRGYRCVEAGRMGRLLHRIGAGLGADQILCAGAAADANRADDLALLHQGNAAAGADHAVEGRHVHRAFGDEILEQLCL